MNMRESSFSDMAPRARQILQLWKLMDFTDVERLPTDGDLKRLGRSLRAFRTNRRKRIDYTFRIPITDPQATSTLLDAIKKETGLSDGWVIANGTVHLGSVSREACIRAFSLACCGDMAPLEDSKRPETTDERVPLLEFSFDEQGERVPETTRLSPLVHLLSRLVIGHGALDGQRSLDELLRSLSDTLDTALFPQADDELTLGNMHRAFIRALSVPAIQRTWHLMHQVLQEMNGGHDSENESKETQPVWPVAYISFTIFRNARVAKAAEDEPRGGLGPFYYSDLELVEQRLGQAHGRGAGTSNAAKLQDIARYVCTGELAAPKTRLDVLTADDDRLTDFYRDVLNPASIPHGRWPSQFDPALMQQVAINLTLRNVAAEKEPLPGGLYIPDYLSVNGPPGTGKTTMLKDIIAGCVVEKARVLAGFERPDDAFGDSVDRSRIPDSGVKQDWDRVKTPYRLSGAAAEANDYGILVASSNNAAVANISVELPQLEGLTGGLDANDEAQRAIRDLFRAGADDPSRFFAGWAQNIHDKQRETAKKEGRRAAPAGTATATSTAAAATASDPRSVFSAAKARRGYGGGRSGNGEPDKNQPPRPTDVWGLISVPLGKTANINRFRDAALTDIQWNHGVDGDEAAQLARYGQSRAAFIEQYDKVSRMLDDLQDVARATDPSVLVWAWEQRGIKADEPCRAFERLGDDALGTRELVRLIKRGFDAGQGDEAAKKEAAKKQAQLAVMWVYRALNRERERLFAYAMELTSRFIQASRRARHNLQLLSAMWGANALAYKDQKTWERIRFSDTARDAAMPALLQTLSLVVPVVSTTFASAGRMLAHVKEPQTFGLLIIDEAGQAVPSQAVGSLFRARRALVVGDPKQIEPVVTEESQLIARVFPESLQRDARPESSVQSYADAQNPIGSTLGVQPSEEFGDPMWMGSPLLVHRRCMPPMFDISNRISYEGAMLLQTAGPKPSKVETFCLPTSFWLEVAGAELGSKNHFVSAQAEAIAPYVARAFELAARVHPDENGVRPSLFLISPFTSVVSGLKQTLGQLLASSLAGAEGFARMDVKGWCGSCIGTVHTFQGKEANEVFLVLGCDANAKGAVSWVKPNIVNVAATRAKYRFCAVGDAGIWRSNDSVRILIDELGGWLYTQCALGMGDLANLSDEEIRQQGYPPREKLPDDGLLQVDAERGICLVRAVANDAESAAATAGDAETETGTGTAATAAAAGVVTSTPAVPNPSDRTVAIPDHSSLDDPWLSATLTLKKLREQEGVDTTGMNAGKVNKRLIEVGALDPVRHLPTELGLSHGIRIGTRANGSAFAVYGDEARAWLRSVLGI